jgi:hypothetical protein
MPNANCPECSFAFEAKSEWSGRRIRCQKCKHTFRLADFGEHGAHEEVEVNPKSASVNWISMAMVATIALVVGGASGIVFGHLRGKAESVAEISKSRLQFEQENLRAETSIKRVAELQAAIEVANDERKKEKDIADAGIRQRDEQLALAHEAEAAAIAKVKAADDRIALLEKSIPSVVDNTQIRITVNRKSDEPLDYKNIWGRVDESIQQTNPLIPAKLAAGFGRLAAKLDASLKPDHFFAYAKASGFCDKNFDPEKLLPTFSVTDGTAENQLISSTKYQFAERVLAWRLLDPEYRLFVSSDDTEEVVKKLKQTMLESTIQTLEYAKNRKLFAGLPYEIDP